MSVPGQSKCLFSLSSPQLKAFLTSKGRPLQIFGMEERDKVVSGFVQGAEGAEFSVHFHDGRTRKPATGYEVSVYFGQKSQGHFYSEPSEVPVDASEHFEGRFAKWSSKRTHVRPFTFTKARTTDDKGEQCWDKDFLDNVGLIKLEYRRIKQSPPLTKEETEKKKEKEKEKAKAAKEKAGKGAGATPRYKDPLRKQDGRLLDEDTDKGNYGKLIPKKLATPYSSSSSTASGWRYDYVDEEEVDITFAFRVRSQAWVEDFLSNDLPETSPSPPPTPPLKVAGQLFLDFSEAEAQGVVAAKRESASTAAKEASPPTKKRKVDSGALTAATALGDDGASSADSQAETVGCSASSGTAPTEYGEGSLDSADHGASIDFNDALCTGE
ncbi:hypothetical protein JCM10207_005656 [Rhodosporidiobolus poonsookiae]